MQDTELKYYTQEGQRAFVPIDTCFEGRSLSVWQKCLVYFQVFVLVFVAFRLDYLFNKSYLKHHAPYYALWFCMTLVVTLVCTFFPVGYLAASAIPLVLFVFSWFYYYALFSWYLNSTRRLKWLERIGKAKMMQRSELLTVSMWNMIGIGYIVFTDAYAHIGWSAMPRLMAYSIYIKALGWCLIVSGYFFKCWATKLIGLNNYFWRDQIIFTKNEKLVSSSLFRFASHPTYTLGYLQMFGYALVQMSLCGLLASVICQLGILMLVKYAEEPGMERLYGNSSAQSYNGDNCRVIS